MADDEKSLVDKIYLNQDKIKNMLGISELEKKLENLLGQSVDRIIAFSELEKRVGKAELVENVYNNIINGELFRAVPVIQELEKKVDDLTNRVFDELSQINVFYATKIDSLKEQMKCGNHSDILRMLMKDADTFEAVLQDHLKGHLRVYELIDSVDKPVDEMWKKHLQEQLSKLDGEKAVMEKNRCPSAEGVNSEEIPSHLKGDDSTPSKSCEICGTELKFDLHTLNTGNWYCPNYTHHKEPTDDIGPTYRKEMILVDLGTEVIVEKADLELWVELFRLAKNHSRAESIREKYLLEGDEQKE